MAAATAGATSMPRVTTVAPGSLLLPQGASAPAQAPGAAAATATTQAAAPAAAAPETPAKAGAGGVFGAIAGAGLLQKALALVPIAAGVTQILIGLSISRGKLPFAMVPLIGGWPKFVVGSLVSATAVPTVLGGVSKLLGRKLPGASA